MLKETITRIKLTATDGMILTNGSEYGKVIFLGDTASPEDYHEITEVEYNEILARAEAEAEAEINEIK